MLGKKRDFILLGHRGASAEEPENTLASIKRAFLLGVDRVEIDVHLSCDLVPMVIHDATLERTTNAGSPLQVCDLSCDELRALDAGSWFSPVFKGEKIPLLEEVVPLGPLMIELKAEAGMEKALVLAVLKVLNGSTEHWIGSFSPLILELIAQQAPKITRIFITERLDFTHKEAMLALEESLITPPCSHIIAWTVDDPARAHTLISQGIKGIITNNPRLFL